MGVKLTEEEIWAFVASGHTGVFTTLRRDGLPVALPVWFVVSPERRILLSTPRTAAKIGRIHHDPRASFLVESGTLWSELSAVHLHVHATIVTGDEASVALESLDAKYAGYKPSLANLPSATRQYYEAQMSIIALEVVGSPLSWDNARVGRPRTQLSEES